MWTYVSHHSEGRNPGGILVVRVLMSNGQDSCSFFLEYPGEPTDTQILYNADQMIDLKNQTEEELNQE